MDPPTSPSSLEGSFEALKDVVVGMLREERYRVREPVSTHQSRDSWADGSTGNDTMLWMPSAHFFLD